MRASSYISKMNDYRKCMKMLECAHSIYIQEIEHFDFKKISKYNKSRNIYNKISSDFILVNSLIKQKDLLNAATILRTLYENIIYIIATSFKNDIKIKLDTPPGKLRSILEENTEDLFTNYFDSDDFDDIYKYLCKIVHPSSLKELMSYLTNTIKYKEYMLNNIKYIMVTIEYMYLNFLNKRIGNVDNSFHLNLIDCSTYVNLVNITYFLSEVKNGMSVVKKYMMYDTNNKYIEDKERIGQQLIDEISKNKEMINICIKDLTSELDKQIIINNYKELVDDIFKNRS